MRKIGFKLLIFLLLIGTLSCSPKPQNESGILQQFEAYITKNITERNAKGDAIDNHIKLDTLYVEDLSKENYRLAFAQYHTADSKLNIAILGIDNFKSSNTPMYLLTGKEARHYRIDSVRIVNDSLHVFCRVTTATTKEKIRIRYNLRFNGTDFPWDMEDLD